MTWTTLNFAYGAVLTSAQMNQLYANFQGYANSDAGSPNAIIDNSSATNDITLGLNQIAMVKIAGSQAIRLCIATADYQEYDVSYFSTIDNVNSTALSVTLNPNSASDAGNFYYQQVTATGGVISGAGAVSNAMVICDGNPRSFKSRICTSVGCSAIKQSFTHAHVVYAGATREQVYTATWTRTTSAWMSLGVINLPAPMTGVAYIRRVA